MDEADREGIRQRFEKLLRARQEKARQVEAIDRLVRILQVVVPLAAAAQLGRLEEREYWNPDDEELVKRRLLVAKLLGTLTS